MPDIEDLIIQLSGVRIGQRDKGRMANVAGHLLHAILKEQWDSLSKRAKAQLTSKSAEHLLQCYEFKTKEQKMRTKEAARQAIEEEIAFLKRELKIE